MMKKVRNILADILIVLVVIVSLTMSVLVISSRSTGVPNLLGYSLVSVLSDSMSGTFEEGDLIIIKASTR
jgi:signal peptidase I